MINKKQVDEIRDILSHGKTVFLIGAGCSKCVGLPLISELSSEVEKSLSDEDKAILLAVKKNFKDQREATIEDYMSEIVDFISILNRRNNPKEKIKIETQEISLDQLSETLNQIKRSISNIIRNKDINIQIHRDFINSLFKLRKNRSESTFPIDFFILNYDTLFEDALALEKIKSSDGFNGGATAYWDISLFKDYSIKARILKIHGSIDWVLLKDSESQLTPFKLKEKITLNETNKDILIWPTSSKYKEAQNNPYLQIMQKFRESLQGSRNIVLAVLGYSFRDNHINEEIRIALEQYGGELTIVIFTEKSPDNISFLKEIRENFEITKGKVKIYSKEGLFHGEEIDEGCKVWKFEDIVKILKGESPSE